jgi:hypothetical protein
MQPYSFIKPYGLIKCMGGNKLSQNVFWKFPWRPNNLMEYYMNRLDQVSLICDIKWDRSIITDGSLLMHSTSFMDYAEKRIDFIDSCLNVKNQPYAVRINHLFKDMMDVIVHEKYLNAAAKKQKQ